MSKYKYKISETTKEQREEYVSHGELSRLGGGEPSEFARRYSADYINGKIELKEATEKVIAHYRRT